MRGQDYVDAMLARNGGLTSHKLVDLVEELPDESRFLRFITGNASLIEQLAAGVYNILGAAHSEEDTFEPISVNAEVEGDDDDDLDRDSASTEELEAWFAGDLDLAALISEGGEP